MSLTGKEILLETVAQNYWQFVTAIDIEWGKSDLCITAFRICRGRGIYLEICIKTDIHFENNKG